jgi:hypothetical protein
MSCSSIHRIGSHQTLKPSRLRHCLCCSISLLHSSSPFSSTQTSRGCRVSGQAQQMRSPAAAGDAAGALTLTDDDGDEDDAGDEAATTTAAESSATEEPVMMTEQARRDETRRRGATQRLTAAAAAAPTRAGAKVNQSVLGDGTMAR